MKNKKLYFIALAPFVIGLIFGSFFDYQINDALFIDPKTNVFGLIFSAFMPIISYSFLAFISGYALNLFIKEKESIFWRIILIVAAIGYYVCTVYFTGNKFISVNAFGIIDGADKFDVLHWIVCAIIDAFITLIGFKAAKENGSKEDFVQLVILSAAIMVSLVPVSQIMKNIMRRPRYRTFEYYAIPGAKYVNWWESFKSEYTSIKSTYGNMFDDIPEEFKSFPSGHTGEAGMTIFGLPYMFKSFQKLQKREGLFFGIGLGFTILMAISRMTMGAHYLSDVSIGGLLMVICCIIANEFGPKLVKLLQDKTKLFSI